MSKNLSHRDQHKLNQILERVKTLSDEVEELRTEVNDLKKTFLRVNHQSTLLESTKVFKSDSASFNSTIHCKRQKDQKSLFRKSSTNLSIIHNGLKSFKNKIIKAVQNASLRQSSMKTKDKCVTFDQQQVCLLYEEKKGQLLNLKRQNENTISNRNTDISEESTNLTDTSFTSDTSTHGTSTCSWRENNENSDYLPCHGMINNSAQVASPLSTISDKQSIIPTNRIVGDFLKNYSKTFSRNGFKRYARCSCGIHCPYASYKLPCDKYRYDISRKRNSSDEESVGGLALECLSFVENNNFSKTVNIGKDSGKHDKLRPDFGLDQGSSTSSSLSLDLEANICSDRDSCSENIDEFTKQRRARTYIVSKMSARRNDEFIRPRT